jgi:adenylate kinase
MDAMKLIFVCGLADIDKTSLIDLALQRAGAKAGFRLVDLDKIYEIPAAVEGAESVDAARQMLARFYDGAEKTMIAKLKEHRGDIVVSGSLTFRTKYGYMRAIPDDFFRTFKPDSVVIIEKANEKDDEISAEHQRMNRYYGAIYSSVSGSALSIIKFNEKKMVDAVGELSEIIKH